MLLISRSLAACYCWLLIKRTLLTYQQTLITKDGGEIHTELEMQVLLLSEVFIRTCTEPYSFRSYLMRVHVP